MIAPASLNRQLQLDACGLCHSGLQPNLKPAFTFSPGDSLSKYYKIDNDTSSPLNLDVHGNKFALLQSSKCFRMSPSMTCSTCHNTHKDEHGKSEIFSAKCSGCHTGAHKPIPAIDVGGAAGSRKLSEAELRINCVSCHMPRQSSKTLTVRLQNEETATPAILRTHHIAIYPEETANLYKYLDSMFSKTLRQGYKVNDQG